MPDVQVTLNGAQATSRTVQSLIDLARENGMDIPTRCHIEGPGPAGACRACVVEVENEGTGAGVAYADGGWHGHSDPFVQSI